MNTKLEEIREIIFSEKSMEKSIDSSIRKDPNKFAQIIAPVIGPSIRMAVVDYFERMMLAFNRAIENSFSLRGLVWRWEAIRSGRPFSEIVLLHSLLFRVEDIFVIHKNTGILLVHSTSLEKSKKTGDRVAAMLTAIHDFASETFSLNKVEQKLSSIRVGEANLLMEESQDLLIVAAIRGEVPSDFRQKLQKKLIDFQDMFSSELALFNGNVDVFTVAEPAFRECLLQEFKPNAKGKFELKKVSKIPAIIFLSVIVGLLGWWGIHLYFNFQRDRHLQEYLAKLEKLDGIVFLGLDKAEKKHWTIRVLKSDQRNTIVPALPKDLEGRVRVMIRPLPATPSPLFKAGPLDEIRLPYHSENKIINGDINEQMMLFSQLVKKLIESSAENQKKVWILAYTFDDPEDFRTKLLLSRTIGLLENSLVETGIANSKIIRYSILDNAKEMRAPFIRFEVLYD